MVRERERGGAFTPPHRHYHGTLHLTTLSYRLFASAIGRNSKYFSDPDFLKQPR
jgi:hypothetical protein